MISDDFFSVLTLKRTITELDSATACKIEKTRDKLLVCFCDLEVVRSVFFHRQSNIDFGCRFSEALQFCKRGVMDSNPHSTGIIYNLTVRFSQVNFMKMRVVMSQ